MANGSSKNHHTVLFKKLLSSFFSKDAMLHLGMNPASMFVSFVSSRQFFGLINRRMTENYKLNLLDINLDSFDVKIGFGQNPTVTMKHIDIYYAYNSSANFIGYKSYSPTIIASGLSMFFAAQTVEIFEHYDDVYFNNFIFTIYFLCFIFISRIKVFPSSSQQEQFDRFVSFFWSFYVFLFEQTKQSLEAKKLNAIKIHFTDDLKTMFALFHIMKDLNSYFDVAPNDHKEFLGWLLAGEIHHKTHSVYAKQYIELHHELSQTTHFSQLEKEIVDYIVPADITIKYLFSDGEGKMIAQHILSTIYPPQYYQSLLKTFIYHGESTKEIIEQSVDFSRIKKHFFYGLQNYTKAKLQNLSSTTQLHPLNTENIEESLDEFLSYLSENDQIDLSALPKNIQIQSVTFDKLINFYISFVGGLWIARGDTGALRVQHPTLLHQLSKSYPLFGSNPETIQFYSDYFKYYEKNVFYYQYIYNHVRSGKESFVLPSQVTSIPHDYNIFVVQLLHESYRSILLQDSYHIDIKLFIKKPEILAHFKILFGEQISTLIKLSHEELLQELFSHLDTIAPHAPVSTLIAQSLAAEEVSNMKNRMYCLDFWLNQRLVKLVGGHIREYNIDSALLVMTYATIKETLFGLLLFLQYIKSCEESHQKNYESEQLIILYCQSILGVNFELQPLFVQAITKLLQEYEEMLSLRTLLDDNQDYMYIGFNSRNSWIEQHHATEILNELNDEDIIWFRGYLKHISYYNKRFLIPSS